MILFVLPVIWYTAWRTDFSTIETAAERMRAQCIEFKLDVPAFEDLPRLDRELTQQEEVCLDLPRLDRELTQQEEVCLDLPRLDRELTQQEEVCLDSPCCAYYNLILLFNT